MVLDHRKYLQKQLEKHLEQIEFKPEDSTIPYRTPLSLQKKSEYDKAIKDFEKAIKFNPDDASAYYNRGLTFQKKRETDAAIADFNKAVELDKNFLFVYMV